LDKQERTRILEAAKASIRDDGDRKLDRWFAESRAFVQAQTRQATQFLDFLRGSDDVPTRDVAPIPTPPPAPRLADRVFPLRKLDPAPRGGIVPTCPPGQIAQWDQDKDAYVCVAAEIGPCRPGYAPTAVGWPPQLVCLPIGDPGGSGGSLCPTQHGQGTWAFDEEWSWPSPHDGTLQTEIATPNPAAGSATVDLVADPGGNEQQVADAGAMIGYFFEPSDSGQMDFGVSSASLTAAFGLTSNYASPAVAASYTAEFGLEVWVIDPTNPTHPTKTVWTSLISQNQVGNGGVAQPLTISETIGMQATNVDEPDDAPCPPRAIRIDTDHVYIFWLRAHATVFATGPWTSNWGQGMASAQVTVTAKGLDWTFWV